MRSGNAEMRLYLETSVPNFLFAEDAPDKRLLTEELFKLIQQGEHEAVVLTLFLDEIGRAPEPLRTQLEGVRCRYGLDIVRFTDACQALADAYIEARAFTEANRYDASHVATAAHHGCDVAVS